MNTLLGLLGGYSIVLGLIVTTLFFKNEKSLSYSHPHLVKTVEYTLWVGLIWTFLIIGLFLLFMALTTDFTILPSNLSPPPHGRSFILL